MKLKYEEFMERIRHEDAERHRLEYDGTTTKIYVESDQCYTPPEVRHQITTFFQSIDPSGPFIDLCNSEASASLIHNMYGPWEPCMNNMLSNPTDGATCYFMNNPFSRKAGGNKRFIEAFIEHLKRNEAIGILLMNSDTSTEAWHLAASHSPITIFPKKRMSFLDKEGNPRKGNSHAQSLHIIDYSIMDSYITGKLARIHFKDCLFMTQI